MSLIAANLCPAAANVDILNLTTKMSTLAAAALLSTHALILQQAMNFDSQPNALQTFDKANHAVGLRKQRR